MGWAVPEPDIRCYYTASASALENDGYDRVTDHNQNMSLAQVADALR